ncbi:inorganic phosphate transporter [Acetobacter indonesiensis]|uniref:inorganic phosphate transporter n=1 Tax=Acetobacter indonesiensis TaxID=104101 RepID=UPI0020A4D3EF|nr:inorganic phosphate transporter [Acetobacter indonesiensis]MCP1231002.1 inorganic phosphate transporter [Acetobacter indonesiensis]
MLHFTPDSPLSIVMLVLCGILVCVFEFVNGFHDTANAVATVIYTRSLRPGKAVILSGIMNFLGVLAGGLSVAYALVELLPPDVLSPPDGAPAVPMLLALFGTALAWNLFTWRAGIPNSSSHCVIGAIVGVAIGDAFVHGRHLGDGVDWQQVLKVLEALAFSPLLGLLGAGLLYQVLRAVVKNAALFQPPPEGDAPPQGWVRWLLVGTCSAVSFSHGSNDGQKSIGLIMLTVVGLWPTLYALDPHQAHLLPMPPAQAAHMQQILMAYDHDGLRTEALAAADRMQAWSNAAAQPPGSGALQSTVIPSPVVQRGDVFQVVAGLKKVERNTDTPTQVKAEAKALRNSLKPVVEFAPWWVRLLSAMCLSLGTMIGYQRIVRTLGEKIGRTHLTPAQGASAELVGAGLILTAGYTGLPVSTTHIVTAGIAGSMLGSGSGLQRGMVGRIVLAWLATLPVTIGLAAVLFYGLSL